MPSVCQAGDGADQSGRDRFPVLHSGLNESGLNESSDGSLYNGGRWKWMVGMDFEIERCTRHCAASGRELAEGEEFYSVLLREGRKSKRRDYACDAWPGAPEGANWVVEISHAAARDEQTPTGSQRSHAGTVSATRRRSEQAGSPLRVDAADDSSTHLAARRNVSGQSGPKKSWSCIVRVMNRLTRWWQPCPAHRESKKSSKSWPVCCLPARLEGTVGMVHRPSKNTSTW